MKSVPVKVAIIDNKRGLNLEYYTPRKDSQCSTIILRKAEIGVKGRRRFQKVSARRRSGSAYYRSCGLKGRIKMLRRKR